MLDAAVSVLVTRPCAQEVSAHEFSLSFRPRRCVEAIKYVFHVVLDFKEVTSHIFIGDEKLGDAQAARRPAAA